MILLLRDWKLQTRKYVSKVFKIRKKSLQSTYYVTSFHCNFQMKALEEKLVSLNTHSSALKRKCDDYINEISKLKLDVS